MCVRVCARVHGEKGAGILVLSFTRFMFFNRGGCSDFRQKVQDERDTLLTVYVRCGRSRTGNVMKE